MQFDCTGIPFTVHASKAGYGAPFFSGPSPGFDPSDVVVSLAGSHAISFVYGVCGTTLGTPVTFELSTGDIFVRLLPPNPGTDTGFMEFVSTIPITGLTISTVPHVPSPPPVACSLGGSRDLFVGRLLGAQTVGIVGAGHTGRLGATVFGGTAVDRASM